MLGLVLCLAPEAILGLSQRISFAPPFSFEDYWAEVAELVPDFGGVFLSPEGTLNIYVLSPDPARNAEVTAALQRVFGDGLLKSSAGEDDAPSTVDTVVLHQANHSMQDLLAMKARVAHLADGESILYIDVDETQNQLVIGVATEVDAQLVRLHLRVHNVPPEAVRLRFLPEDLQAPPDQIPLSSLVGLWHQRLRSPRFADLPQIGVIGFVPDDGLVPFRAEIISRSAVLLLAREMRMADIPLSTIFLLERE